jgi:radical SAM protein with 4Fe4S-binding SPASM domain
MAVKDLAKALAQRTFDAAPPLYCTTLAAGVRLLRSSPMTRPGQINERPYSTLMKFLEMGRRRHADRAARKALYEELRQQLVQLRDDAAELDAKREMNRLLNRLERDEGELQLLSYPVRGYIEVTNFCNLRCQMCGQSYFDDHGGKRSHLAREAYREIVKSLPYQDETTVTGFGESLLSPYFWELMDLLPWGGRKKLISNGTLLDRDTSARLMKYPINDYTISFEAIDRETYRFIRSGDHLDRVIQNLKDLDANRKAAGRTDIQITIAFVAMRRNIEQLPEFVRRVKTYGADSLQVSFLHVTRPHLIPESLYHEPQLANRMFEEGRKAAEEVGLLYWYPKDFQPRPGRADRSRRVRDCYEPWEFIYFESSGKVRPCCIYDKNMGRVPDSTYESVWNDEAYRSLRKTVNSPHPEPYCAKCWMVHHVDHNDRRFHINLVDKRGVYLDEDQADQGVWE